MELNMPLILVVDDDESLRDLVCEILTRAGYRVSVAGSSKCGYCRLSTSLLLGRPFDLVVSDVVMPEETGPAMMERLRVERGVVFPSLFISGYTRPALVLKGLLGTGQEFMQKPFNSAALLSKVKSMLARKGRPR